MSDLLANFEASNESQDNKRTKVSLGPIEDPPATEFPPAGLLQRQLTLDNDSDNLEYAPSFVPEDISNEISSHACFGAGKLFRRLIKIFRMFDPYIYVGCYWGTEHFLKNHFGIKHFEGRGKVLSGEVGFMGPFTAKANPSYPEVRWSCSVM